MIKYASLQHTIATMLQVPKLKLKNCLYPFNHKKILKNN